MTSKFDLQSILNNIKSMINPESSTPDVKSSNDAIGMKVVELSLLVQQLAKKCTEQAKEFNKVNELLNDLFKDIEVLRAQFGTSPVSKSSEKEGVEEESIKK